MIDGRDMWARGACFAAMYAECAGSMSFLSVYINWSGSHCGFGMWWIKAELFVRSARYRSVADFCG